MQDKPFWEQSYSDYEVSTFSKGPTADVEEFYEVLPRNADVLDVGCGEGGIPIFWQSWVTEWKLLIFQKME
mgnify:CR=1 FL=1